MSHTEKNAWLSQPKETSASYFQHGHKFGKWSNEIKCKSYMNTLLMHIGIRNWSSFQPWVKRAAPSPNDLDSKEPGKEGRIIKSQNLALVPDLGDRLVFKCVSPRIFRRLQYSYLCRMTSNEETPAVNWKTTLQRVGWFALRNCSLDGDIWSGLVLFHPDLVTINSLVNHKSFLEWWPVRLC